MFRFPDRVLLLITFSKNEKRNDRWRAWNIAVEIRKSKFSASGERLVNPSSGNLIMYSIILYTRSLHSLINIHIVRNKLIINLLKKTLKKCITYFACVYDTGFVAVLCSHLNFLSHKKFNISYRLEVAPTSQSFQCLKLIREVGVISVSDTWMVK